MKFRILYIALLLGFCVFCTTTVQCSPFDRVIPSDTLFYWGYDGSINSLPTYPNYDQSMKNWWDLMGDILEWRVIQEECAAAVKKSGVEEGLAALSGSQHCFALYPLIEGTPLPGIGLYMAEVADPERAEKVLSALYDEFDSLIPSFHSVKDEYYGYWIRSIYCPVMLPGFDLAYTIKDSMLMISNSKSMLLRIIDQLDEGQGFLADMETYQKAIVSLPENRNYTFFANLSQISDTSSNLLKNLDALQKLGVAGNLDEILPWIQGFFGFLHSFQSYASARAVDPQSRWVTSSHLLLNLNIENEAVRGMMHRTPEPFVFERYLPRKVGTVTSANILGPRDLWMLFHTYLSDSPPVKELFDKLSAWENESGFSIDRDLFAWMGDSWGFLRPVMDLDSVIATNQGALFLEVSDPEAAEQGLQKLVDLLTKSYQLPLVESEETYLTTRIHTLTFPLPLVPIAPSWCIHENTLILSTRPNMIREMLDIDSGVSNGMNRNRQYKYLQDVLRQPANKMSFQDNESEFYAFREAIRKVGSIPDAGNIFLDDMKILPSFFLDRAAYLLSCWQVRRGTVKRTILQDNDIATEKVCLYGDLRALPPLDSINRTRITLGAQDVIALCADYSQKSGNWERALRMDQILADYFPNDSRYLSRIAALYKSQGDLAQAQAVFDRAIEKTPEIAYLIGRENLFENSSTEEISERVLAITGKTLRIREDASFFGIALAKRDAGKTETALDLFEKVLLSSNSSDSLIQAAKNETALLKHEAVTDMMEVPFTPNPPAMDGKMEKAIWDKGKSFSLTNGGDANQIGIRLLRDESNLYIALEGKSAQPAKNVRVLFCPSRDYTHVVEWTVEKNVENQPVATMRHRVIDPFHLTLDSDDSDSSLSPSDLASNLPGVLQVIQKVLTTGIVDEKEFQNFHSSPGTISTAWTELTSENSTTDCLEFAIPWTSFQTESAAQSVWLWNLIRTDDSGEGDKKVSLSGGDNVEEPFTYRLLRIQ